MVNAIRYGTYNYLSFFLTAILFFFVYSATNAQEADWSDKERAEHQIVQLKEKGAIVVRLKTSKRTIEAYQSAGKVELANKLINEQYMDNKELVLSFTQNMDFCPVYFIYAEDYNKIRNQVESGYFLNEDLEVDTSIRWDHNYYLFCELGPVYEQVLTDPSNAKTKQVSSTPVLQDALVLKDIDLNQLLDPFPFYISVRTKGIYKASIKLNEKLFEYYRRVIDKQDK